jgi:hypothetical protein
MTFEHPEEPVEAVMLPQAVDKAIEVSKAHKIELDDFADLYKSSLIAADKHEVDRLRQIFIADLKTTHEQNIFKQSKIFEAIIFDQGVEAGWFGENANLVRTSSFDDWKNGVDAVVEYDQQGTISQMAMSIDVTFSHNVRKKMDRIMTEISHGKMGEVRYFVSEFSNIRGELSKLPRFIVGADIDTVRELTNLWVEETDESKEALAKHPVQFEFFAELIKQCEYFAGFALKKAQANEATDSDLAQKQRGISITYERIQRLLGEKLAEKQSKIGKDENVRDSFMADLENNLRSSE